jgi:hypothetical protein
MFNAGFDLLGTTPVLQPLADLAMHVFEQPKQRANAGFLPRDRAHKHRGTGREQTNETVTPMFVKPPFVRTVTSSDMNVSKIAVS